MAWEKYRVTGRALIVFPSVLDVIQDFEFVIFIAAESGANAGKAGVVCFVRRREHFLLSRMEQNINAKRGSK